MFGCVDVLMCWEVLLFGCAGMCGCAWRCGCVNVLGGWRWVVAVGGVMWQAWQGGGFDSQQLKWGLLFVLFSIMFFSVLLIHHISIFSSFHIFIFSKSIALG
jgi:hypothetical protein